MKHFKAELNTMGIMIAIEFKVYNNRVYMNSNNPMMRANFIKFMENQAVEAMKKDGQEPIPIKQSNNSTWVEMTMPFADEESSEQTIVDKFKKDLKKANMKVTMIK